MSLIPNTYIFGPICFGAHVEKEFLCNYSLHIRVRVLCIHCVCYFCSTHDDILIDYPIYLPELMTIFPCSILQATDRCMSSFHCQHIALDLIAEDI